MSAQELARQESLYDRLGGDFTINQAIDLFYSKVFSDRKLAPFFEGISLDKQVQQQKHFMGMAFGGPVSHKSINLRAIHRPLVDRGLNDEHVDLFIRYFRETMEELNIDKVLVEEAATLANSFRNQILDHQP